MTKATLASITALAFALVLASPPGHAGERIVVEHKKEPTGGRSGLEYRYTFDVKTHKSKTPVEGADFMIATDMPSMPGAHHMPHVKAEPGKTPGTYTATIDFDMAGPWSLILRFSKPHRDQIVVSDHVLKQPGGEAKKQRHDGHDHSKH